LIEVIGLAVTIPGTFSPGFKSDGRYNQPLHWTSEHGKVMLFLMNFPSSIIILLPLLVTFF
jgi:hypothetical protein